MFRTSLSRLRRFTPKITAARPSVNADTGTTIEDTLLDICNQIKIAGGKLPLGKMIHVVNASTKQAVITSGKGVEGFVKAHPQTFHLGNDRTGTKLISIVAEPQPKEGEVEELPSLEPDSLFTPPMPIPPLVTSFKASQAQETEGIPAGDQIAEGVSAWPLRVRLFSMMEPKRYYNVNALHFILFAAVRSVSVPSFTSHIKSEVASGHYWLHVDPATKEEWICKRNVDRPKEDDDVPDFSPAKVRRIRARANRFNVVDWGPPTVVPTSTDLWEVLKWTPLEWFPITGYHCMSTSVRRMHIRVGSIAKWFGNLPRFFEMRVMNGQIDVRRHPILHPEAFGITPDEGCELVARRLDEDQAMGGSSVITKAIRMHLAGKYSTEAQKISENVRSRTIADLGVLQSARPVSPGGMANIGIRPIGLVSTVITNTTAHRYIPRNVVERKLMELVPGGYYVPILAVFQRIVDVKGLTLEILQNICESECKDSLSMIVSPYNSQFIYIRKKATLDLEKEFGSQIATFEADLHNAGPHFTTLNELMRRTCGLYDRIEYIKLLFPKNTWTSGVASFAEKFPAIFVVSEDKKSLSRLQAFASAPMSADDTHAQCNDSPYWIGSNVVSVLHSLTPEIGEVHLSELFNRLSPAILGALRPQNRLQHLAFVAMAPPRRLVTTEHPRVSDYTVRRTQQGPPELREKFARRILQKIPSKNGLTISDLDALLCDDEREILGKMYPNKNIIQGRRVIAFCTDHPEFFRVLSNPGQTPHIFPKDN